MSHSLPHEPAVGTTSTSSAQHLSKAASSDAVERVPTLLVQGFKERDFSANSPHEPRSAAVPAASSGGVSPLGSLHGGTPCELAGQKACATKALPVRGLDARSIVSGNSFPELIFFPGRCKSLQALGGKAKALAALRGGDWAIPEWFVLLPNAFQISLSEHPHEALEAAVALPSVFGGVRPSSGPSSGAETLLSKAGLEPSIAVKRAEIAAPEDGRTPLDTELPAIGRVLEDLKPAASVRAALHKALELLCPNNERVAVRSSAIDEDGEAHSFAGQLESFLFVAPDEILEKIVAVWKSAFSPHVFDYRRKHDLPLVPPAPAVLIQRMLNPDVAGVAFGADPVSGDTNFAVVSAVFGLGTALVSDASPADTWRVSANDEIIDRAVVEKQWAYHFDAAAPNRLGKKLLPRSMALQPALSDEQIRAIALLARQLGDFFGRPQDIEWAIENDKLYLLQSRAITTLQKPTELPGKFTIWDNSNIAESYNGVTTPLTFSFARRAYEEVYRQFCRLLAVPECKIVANEETFRQMLGLVQGRVYYNLLNWHRVLALLPGFTFNRRFMEQMMGVKEGLPDDVVAELGRATWKDRLRDQFYLARSAARLVWNYGRISKRTSAFYHRVTQALTPPKKPWAAMRADELIAYYQSLEQQMLKRWDAPLLNDFFTMIFCGVLRKLAARWCDDSDGSLSNELLCADGAMISAEPAKHIRALAEMAHRHAAFARLLRNGQLAEVLASMLCIPGFADQYKNYLERFGERCLEELKLETTTLHEDPLPLLRAIGQLALSDRGRQTGATQSTVSIRVHAGQKVATALGGHPLRQLVFEWILRQARIRLRERENLRFERTRVFGRVRRIFVELGRRFQASGLIDDSRDIFHLEIHEIFGRIEGTSATSDLRAIVALRKSEFAKYRQTAPPPDRIETHGIQKGIELVRITASKDHHAAERSGIACSPGFVRGRVRIVTDAKNSTVRPGEILVAKRTDPGWILLFTTAAGLLVENGSWLSHSAIVAREIGLPAIVSITALTEWLADGDLVEMDGSSGVVRRIEKEWRFYNSDQRASKADQSIQF